MGKYIIDTDNLNDIKELCKCDDELSYNNFINVLTLSYDEGLIDFD